jgi:protein CpxP
MRLVGIVILAAVLVLPGLAIAQVAPQAAPPGDMSSAGPLLVHGPGGFPPPLGLGGPHVGESEGAPPFGPPFGHGPGEGLRAWWKDSETVKRLGLSQAQVSQIQQVFLEHRLRRIDLRADLEKQELGLEPLLDAEQPDEAKVAAQLDLITAARGRLMKEDALSLLAIRRVLTADQWKQIQAFRPECARDGRLRMPPGTPGGPGPTRGRQLPPPPPR